MTELISKVIGILTSGGDSQGMNAVIRAVVRLGLHKRFKVYLIYEGYNGLIAGSDLIREADLSAVDHIIHLGGTFIGSSRCKEFREPEGRIKAALTLIERNITNLVVIGGDGSLTGANLLRNEWTSIVNTLVERGQITEEMKEMNSSLNIIGIVGSIDNDFCRSDITTGTDTALHRIVESGDAISATAMSHQRAMIIEVMGRHCGYLALVSAIALEATYTFIPESPPPEDWPQYLCQKIEHERQNGRRLNIIIVSEGALDMNGNPITAAQIKSVISDKTKRDVRVTILGHVQRGGLTSAFDRTLGIRLGAYAVVALGTLTSANDSFVLAVDGNQITAKPLMECVEQTLEVAVAMKNRNWDKCLELRGQGFHRNLQTFKRLHGIVKSEDEISTGNRFAVTQVGEPCSGMNAAVLSFVRQLKTDNQTVFGVIDGLDGLIGGKYEEMKWSDVNGWTSQNGALLGTSKVPPNLTEEHLEQVAKHFKTFGINGLLIIGGFRAFQLALNMIQMKARNKFPELKIPFCIIPATVDNNIPGTDLSLGADSTLNKITQLCTDILVSSRGTKRRLFIINVESGYCGYLTVMSALASGADYCYPFEDNFTADDIIKDANSLKETMIADNRNRLIVVNRFANIKLKPKSIAEIYTEEGNGVFTTHFTDLTNLEQSLCPSPFDRNFGVKLGVECAVWLRNSRKLNETENAVVIGINGRKLLMTNITELVTNTDFEHQIPKNQWFMKFKRLINECS